MDVKLTLTNSEHKELVAYCNLNDLLVSEVVKKSFTTGFNVERYGLLNDNSEPIIKEVIIEVPVEKEVIKEVIVEKIVEIPVDKTDYNERETLLNRIKELENIKPQVIEKEIVVEKISDNGLTSKLELLQNTLLKLKQDNNEKDRKIREYEKLIEDFKSQQDKRAIYLKGSNLGETL
jgi:hypothetical protein